MTTPFYKKRPQWWIKLLDIFHITEKQYWLLISIAIIVALVVLLLASCGYYSCHLPSQDTLFIYQCLCCCIPTAPFGYYWLRHKFKLLPDSWIKTIFATGERATLLEVIAAILSPIVIFYVLLKHYGAK